MSYRIGYLVGSLASDSINGVLSKALVKLAPDDLEMVEIPIRDLPLYNRDDEYNPGSAVTAFKHAIDGSDGLLFISPEYNRSIPGALKNAIDIGSRPWGQNSFAQAHRHHRRLDRRDRHRGHAVVDAQRAELPRCPAAERAGGLHPFRS